MYRDTGSIIQGHGGRDWILTSLSPLTYLVDLFHAVLNGDALPAGFFLNPEQNDPIVSVIRFSKKRCEGDHSPSRLLGAVCLKMPPVVTCRH
jgi:hypothetical protein